MEKNLKIGIVGAGIQGVSNALFLQKKGFNVTIFDRDNPGAQAASYGNAGHFSPYASVPLNRPDVLADVPAMLLSSSGPLALKWNYVTKMIPWFLKFIMNSIIKLSDNAASRIKEIMSGVESNSIGVRVAVKSGGCAGMSYVMEYAKEINPSDEIIEDKGVKVFVDAAAVMYLLGTEMDYKKEEFSSSFVFNNPNESERCGCGESFKV